MARMNYGTASQRSDAASATRYTDWREEHAGKKARKFSKPRTRRRGLLKSLAQKPRTQAERDQYAREIAAFNERLNKPTARPEERNLPPTRPREPRLVTWTDLMGRVRTEIEE